MQSAVPHTGELSNQNKHEKDSTHRVNSDAPSQVRTTGRISRLLNQGVFVSLLVLIFVAAVPYGTVEPWWKAAFVCFVFLLWILGTIEDVMSPRRRELDKWLFVPLFGLVAFALLQSLPIGTRSHPAIPQPVWNAISADPYQTQFFAVQLLAITFAGALLSRYVSTDRRLKALVTTVIAVAVMSAIFGVVRQTNQHGPGFGLPLLNPGRGYAQFINPNHFALLMEMAFGLLLGIVLGSNSKREGLLVYGALLLIVWTALVLANSRGGLLTMMTQIVAAGLLYTVIVPASKASGARRKVSVALRSLPARIVLLVVLLLGVVAGTLWIGGDRLASRFEDLTGGVNPAETRSGGSRNEIWRATWLMFKANPLTGVGLGGYWAAITEYHDASGSLTPQEAHNDYLELLASGGLVSAFLGGWFLLVLAKRIRSRIQTMNPYRRGARYGALLGIIGVLTHSLFDFGLHMLVNALVFAALIVIATSDTHGEDRLRRSNA